MPIRNSATIDRLFHAVSRNGILIAHYERDGEVETGGLPLETPSDREIARQQRMKREG